jgi:hypothetical protein
MGKFFFSWSPPYSVKWREVLLSPVKMFHCSKLPCLGWRSADFLQGFFCPKYLQEQLKHALSSTTISMAPTGKLWPPGAKLSPRGEICPLGAKLSPRGEILWGWSYPPGVKLSVCPSILLNICKSVHPLGRTFPLWANFTTGANHVKNWPLFTRNMILL